MSSSGERLAFSLGGSVGGYSSSALRFGLTNIRPIEVHETIKRFGLRFDRVTRKLEPLQPSESFEDLVTFENEAIFYTIKIPERFDAEKLIKIFSQRSAELYDKDIELKEKVEEVRKAERKGRPFLSFLQFYKRRYESKRDQYLEIEAERFLKSNLPLSFYSKFAVFDNTFYYFLNLLENIVRLYESRASVSRSFLMYTKKIAEMQMRVGPIIDQMDECNFASSRLKKYLCIWNSKDYDEIFDPEYLDLRSVDVSEYVKLYNDYVVKLSNTRKLMLRHDSSILPYRLDSDEITKNVFGKLVMVPSSS